MHVNAKMMFTTSLVLLVTSQVIIKANSQEFFLDGPVTMQSYWGTYACAEHGGNDVVVVNRKRAAAWETFYFTKQTRGSKNYVSIQTHDRQYYLCAEDGGGTFVTANRKAVGDWELFEILDDDNGMFYLKTKSGKYLTAEPSGYIIARADRPQAWEAFRIAPFVAGKEEATPIYVSVYNLLSSQAGTLGIWHSGISFDQETEYFFHITNKVESGGFQQFNDLYHRGITRIAPYSASRVREIFQEVKAEWDKKRYDLFDANCNIFVNAVLNRLGVGSLDKEYLTHSNAQVVLEHIPGSSTVFELVAKWPIKDKRLDEAFMNDLGKPVKLAKDMIEEAKRFVKKAADWGKSAVDTIKGWFGRRLSLRGGAQNGNL